MNLKGRKVTKMPGISDSRFDDGGKVMEKVYIVTSDITVKDITLVRGSFIGIVAKEDGNTFIINTINYKKNISFEITGEVLDQLYDMLEYNDIITRMWKKTTENLIAGTLKLKAVNFTIFLGRALAWISLIFVMWMSFVVVKTPMAYTLAAICIALNGVLQLKTIPVQALKWKYTEHVKVVEDTLKDVEEVLNEIRKMGYKSKL